MDRTAHDKCGQKADPRLAHRPPPRRRDRRRHPISPPEHPDVRGLRQPRERRILNAYANWHQKRWDDARRLLHDDTLKTPDRVVGLLLLLYAQNLGCISRLTIDHVRTSSGQVSIHLGTAPVVLPEPLAALVLELVATRKGNTILDNTATTPWLFPGRRHGQPLSPDYLGQRLKRIDIHAGRDRSTALFALATEIPAAILARMLGIHIKVAVA
jgi:hypothetical protein